MTVTTRSPEEIQERVTGNIKKLNSRLLDVAQILERDARLHEFSRTPPGKILVSFYRKLVKTFAAIEALKKQRFIEEAWILLRVLLETHVNFLFFLKNDGTEMCHRYVDAAILDKLKHLREVHFYEGTAMANLHRRSKWEQTEATIKERYSTQEFESLRRNGFTGLNFQDRAREVGLKIMYEYCYRIASRSVHMFDPAETPVYGAAFRGQAKEKRELLHLRRDQLEFNQNMLLGRPSYLIAEMIESHLEVAKLIVIGLGYEKARDENKSYAIPIERDEDSPPDQSGTFRIWRV